MTREDLYKPDGILFSIVMEFTHDISIWKALSMLAVLIKADRLDVLDSLETMVMDIIQSYNEEAINRPYIREILS